jgi:Na+/phosphate symporter
MARFMCGWVLLGLAVAATVIVLLMLPTFPNWAILLFGFIPYSGLGAWMVWSGAHGSRSHWSAPERGQMTRFIGGWVLVVLGVAAMVSSLLFLFLSAAVTGSSVPLPPGGAVVLFGATLGTALGACGTALGAWMVWGARAGQRIPRAMWALGPLTSVAVAVGWLFALANWFNLFFGAAASEPEVRPLGFLVFGSLFGAPLVGAILVLVDWHRRRQASPPGGESDAGVRAPLG